jgi:hypothetical protein
VLLLFYGDRAVAVVGDRVVAVVGDRECKSRASCGLVEPGHCPLRNGFWYEIIILKN